MPGVEVSSASGNVRSYEFGNHEEVYYCVMCSIWEVRGEGGVFLIYFHMWGLGETGGSGCLQ